MAKKIRFPLNLADGTQARSLDELKEHFDLESVLSYYKSGKLLTWLRDRYIETEADAVEALDEGAPDFQQRLCAIFGAEFSGAGIDMEEIIRRQERMKKLRQFTDEDEFIQNIDFVAFDQEELADLLDDGCGKIYLCGERFEVPVSQKDKAYIGINSPKVKISGNVGDDWEEREIIFTGCKVENLPALVQETTSTAADDDGPVVISDKLAADIFEAIYEDVSEEVSGREIIVETDHYYVIEEVYYFKNEESFYSKTAKHYLRFSKASCAFEELPDLSTFSVASRYYRLGFSIHSHNARYMRKTPPMLSAPTYQFKDTLYMQEISGKDTPSIWRLDLNTKSLVKLMDGIKFLCPHLPAFIFPCDGRYIPVIKDKKFCALDLHSLDLVKVRNKGQWVDIPYAAAIAGTKVYFIVSETYVGRTDRDRKAFCSFDLEQNEFSEVQVVVRENGGPYQLLRLHEYWHADGCRVNVKGLYVQGNKISVLLDSRYNKNFIIDLSTQPICADVFDSAPQYFRNIVWSDKLIYEGSSSLIVTDAVTCETSKRIKLNFDLNCTFARIGDFIYTYNYISHEGCRISLTAPHEQIPFTLSIDALNADIEYDWKPIPEI